MTEYGWYCACGAFHPIEENCVWCSECGSDRILMQNALSTLLQQGHTAEEPTRMVTSIKDESPTRVVTDLTEQDRAAITGRVEEDDGDMRIAQPGRRTTATLPPEEFYGEEDEAEELPQDPDELAKKIIRWGAAHHGGGVRHHRDDRLSVGKAVCKVTAQPRGQRENTQGRAVRCLAALPLRMCRIGGGRLTFALPPWFNKNYRSHRSQDIGRTSTKFRAFHRGFSNLPEAGLFRFTESDFPGPKAGARRFGRKIGWIEYGGTHGKQTSLRQRKHYQPERRGSGSQAPSRYFRLRRHGGLRPFHFRDPLQLH